MAGHLQLGMQRSASEQQLYDAELHFGHQLSAAFFERFKGYEFQELLGYCTSSYLLSGEDFKVQIDPPLGIISQIQSPQQTDVYFLMPVEDGLTNFDMREIHQLARELTVGIFVMNQIPSLSLEANFDESTSALLPPAYIDTRLGQIMLNVDYYMKSLWHGAFIPKDKRLKFSEKWRNSLDVNPNGKPETKKHILTEFIVSGLTDPSLDQDFEHAYDDLEKENSTTTDTAFLEERRFFMKYVDDYCMGLYFFQNTLQMYKNLFIIDSDWTVKSTVKLLEDQIDKAGLERIHSRLQLHELMILKHLPKKLEVRRHMFLLKFVSFLIPWLIAMRKKMKVPELAKFLHKMTGDDIKTEREFPPLMQGPEFKNRSFMFGSRYFHLHGGVQFDYETPDPKPPTDTFKELYPELEKEMKEYLEMVNQHKEAPAPRPEGYPVPIKVINGREYLMFGFDLETFYPQHPHKPKWVQIMAEYINKQKTKRTLNEHIMYDMFKKYFGPKKALKCKNVPYGLKVAACRSMVSIFHFLIRKTPSSRLGKQDEIGLALMHYAAMYNRPQIITLLILQSMDVNVRKYTSTTIHGPTPLHLAAQYGSLHSCFCLLANFANLLAFDHEGWAPIHNAAYFDHKQIVKIFIRRNEALLELPTKDKNKSVPLLLAASSGALSSLKILIDMGANIVRKDELNNNVIHLAALRFHTNILEFFIKWNHPEIKVWTILVGMLHSADIVQKDASVKCLEVMSSSNPDHWRSMVDAGSIPALVSILKLEDHMDLQAVSASVLCNISEHDDVRRALTSANAAPILIHLLSSDNDDIQSRSAIILADLACVDDNQSKMTGLGIVPAIIGLLDSELEDVLLHAVNCIRIMCLGNPINQREVAKGGAVESLVEFLTLNSDRLQAASAAAIAALCHDNKENQDLVVHEQAVKPLVALIKCRKVEVQVKAAAALEALADYNGQSQKAFLEIDAPRQLLKLLKIWQIDVKEQGAMSMWSLAGQIKSQQKDIAERIGTTNLIEMLMIQSEKLQFVGCMGMVALGREDMDCQNHIADQGGLAPLVRLLRSSKTSCRILLTVVKVIGVICLGQALRNNPVTQQKIAEEGAIHTLVGFMVQPPAESEEIQVEAAHSIACVVLGSQANLDLLNKEVFFKYEILLDLLCKSNNVIRLRAGHALAMFAFNNVKQQIAIKKAGGILFDCFEEFLQSKDLMEVCNAAFQVVVLARVILDREQVNLTADGILSLVKLFETDDANAVILAASHLSSLSHTRAGIPDALINLGSIDLLIRHLHSTNEEVRIAVAVCLGYLSFNLNGARILFSRCRNTPGLYDLLINNIGPTPKISEQFVTDYRNACKVGIPCLSLESHGGVPVSWCSKPGRPNTGASSRNRKGTAKEAAATSGLLARVKTAPAGGRSRSAADAETLQRPESTLESASMTSTVLTKDKTFKSRLASYTSET